jgi:predicted DNA-binding transcriptional regulator YafY
VAGVDKLERLTDLILVLLTTSRPLSLNELADQLPGYPEAGEARRMAFERDKRLLREEGITVEAVPIDGDAQVGYRIDAATFFLPDLNLSPEEQAALHLAVAGVHLADDSGGDALRKLGIVDLADAQPVAALGGARGLDRIFQALATDAEVRFRYRGEDRVVYPIRLHFSGGHWYLLGYAKERQGGRNFRVDRIDGEVTVGAPGGAAGVDLSEVPLDSPDEPWVTEGSATPATTLRLAVDALRAFQVVAEVGADAVVAEEADGSVVVEVAVGREVAARSWVLSFLHHAEVLAPESLRAELVAWLEAIVAARRTAPIDRDPASLPPVAPLAVAAPPTTQRRLRRLLAMLDYLAKVGQASTEELAERFEMSVQEVVGELELAACCGTPPFSPGELMDIIVDPDLVTARLPELTRPRQLTGAEGVALAAAAATILAMPGADPDGPLARALAKLEAALGARRAVEVALDVPPLLAEIQAACEAGRSLDVQYLSTSTDELTERRIDPLAVYSLDSRFYVVAFCHRAAKRRTFRVDQFRSVADAGPRASDADEELPEPSSFVPSADTTVALVEVGPGAAWLADSIPVLGREPQDDGTVLVAVAVSGPAWFRRILLQAGPEAVVVAPAGLLDEAAAAAEETLARYRAR